LQIGRERCHPNRTTCRLLLLSLSELSLPSLAPALCSTERAFGNSRDI
jgi:hypothetical protein